MYSKSWLIPFVSDNSRFLSMFWYNLKFGSLFGSNNSEPKIIFLDFFHFFKCILKLGSLFASDNSEPKKNLDFFVNFLV